MSKKAIIAIVVVVVVGVTGFALMLSLGRGLTVYVPDAAIRHRELGEHLLNKRRHTTNKQEKAELLSQAIEEFRLALESKPDFEVAYNMLGHAYIERGQWEDALSNLNRALELRPDYPAALYNRARIYQRLSAGKRDHHFLHLAIADYRAALQSSTAAGIAGDLHKALSETYQQMGDYQQAIDELKQYLKKARHAKDAVLVRRKIRGLQLMQNGTAPLLSEPLE